MDTRFWPPLAPPPADWASEVARFFSFSCNGGSPCPVQVGMKRGRTTHGP